MKSLMIPCKLRIWGFFGFFFSFFFSKVRVGAKEGGSHYWEMVVAITCGYGGYLLPLLAAHSSYFIHMTKSSVMIFINFEVISCFIPLHYFKFSVAINHMSTVVHRLSPTASWTGDPRDVADILPLTYWGRDKMAAISQTTLSNDFSWMKRFEFRLRFYWNLLPRVQLTIFQHWFR